MSTSIIRGAIVCATCALSACPAALAQLDPRSEVMYHFMPIAWRDSDNDAQRFGDFQGMLDSLDYLEDLGITAVWMNPIFPSPAYHGYQHGPGDQLNPWFGTEADWIAFVEAAHARGIKVFIDFVVYGISHDSTWFQSAWSNPASPYDDWLAFTNNGNTQYLGSVYSTWSGAQVGFIHWDLRNPDVFALVADWGKKWLDPNEDGDFSDGVDGYRLDHVWQQYGSGPDGWGYNLDDFWEPWKAELQSVNPDVFIFAEQADWGITGANLLTAFDAAMTKPLEFAVRSALNDGNADGVRNAAGAAWNSLPPNRYFMGIVGDHDVDRLMSVLGDSTARAKAAAAILLTHPFVPMIYFGDEIGMRGTKGNWGSDANDIPFREPFKWNAVAGPPMTNYWILNNQAYTNRVSQNNDGISVQEQTGVASSLLETYRKLISLRASTSALRLGQFYLVPASSQRIYSFLRQSSNQTILVMVNCSALSTTFTVNLSNFTVKNGQSVPFNLWTLASVGTPLTEANKGAYPVTLGPHAYAIYLINLEQYVPPTGLVSGLDIPSKFEGALATQNKATTFGDNVSEANQLFGRIEDGFLHLGITGNLATDGTGIAVFVDARSGGQSMLDLTNLSPPPYGPDQLSFTVMENGFVPETMFFANANGGSIYADQYTLLDAGGATKAYRGAGVVNTGNGFLAGGTNLNGLEFAIHNSNTTGVTDTSAADAPLATSGIEMAIPLVDLGLAPDATTPIHVFAFITGWDGYVSTQVLPPTDGTLAIDPGYSPWFHTEPGVQFATVLAPGAPCPADINGDGLTNAADFTILAGNFGASVPTNTGGDLNGDGVVNAADFTILAGDFGCGN